MAREKFVSTPMSLRFKPISESTKANPDEITLKKQTIDLGNLSEVVYIPKFLTLDDSWKFFDYLNKEIPWTRPTIRVFGRSCLQVIFQIPVFFLPTLVLSMNL